MQFFGPSSRVHRTVFQLSNRAHKVVDSHFIIALLVDLNVGPETIHVASETWETGKGLHKRIHVASVAEVREADSERILLERTP